MAAAAPELGKLSENYGAGLTLHAGKSTVVEVPFTGAPQPSVTWKWNGQQLPDPTRTTAQTLHNATALTLNRVQRSDAGTYNLLLENSAGKATFAVKVKVIGEYKIYVITSLLSDKIFTSDCLPDTYALLVCVCPSEDKDICASVKETVSGPAEYHVPNCKQFQTQLNVIVIL